MGVPSVGHDSSTARSRGPGRVRADRGGVHERTGAGGGRGREHPPRARDVRGLQRRLVARGLDQPGQVDHRVGPAEVPGQLRGGHVGLHPARARRAPGRAAPRQADDLGDARVGGQGLDHAGADVPGRAGDHDAHVAALPGRLRRQTGVRLGLGTRTIRNKESHASPPCLRRHPLRRQGAAARGGHRAAQDGLLDGDRDGDELHHQLDQPGRRARPGDRRVAPGGHPGGARARAAVRHPHQGALRRRPRLARVQPPSRATSSRRSTRPTSST